MIPTFSACGAKFGRYVAAHYPCQTQLYWSNLRLLLSTCSEAVFTLRLATRPYSPTPPTPATYYRKQLLAFLCRYWPDVDETKLVPDYSGIRPKLAGPGGDDADDHALDGRRDGRCAAGRAAGTKRGAAADFMIQGRASHGVGGLVNLLGIESPGLTASLAIAEHVVDLVEKEEGT